MDYRHILVVRMGSLGDIIHTLPAVATLKHSFPRADLHWVVDPKWAGLLEGNPFVDRVVTLARKSWRSVREAWGQLRSVRFDLAVDFQGLVKSALVASAARPDKIFGFHQSQAREKLAALFYSDRTRVSAAHVVDRNLELAVASGATSILRTFPVPQGRAEGTLPEGEFVLASPLGGWPGKQWPLESYRALGVLLREKLRVPLVLNGPPSAAETLRSMAGTVAHVSGIPGLIDATRRALAVVGIDSGPLHLAAALGKPGVGVYGPTDPARNGPYGGSIEVLRSPSAETTYKRRAEVAESMRAITAEAVFEALQGRLARLRESAGSSV